MYIKTALVVLSLFILTGCSTKTYQQKAKPTTQEVSKDKVRVIINRASVFPGSACSHKVYDGNDYIGELGNGGSLIWDREPTPLMIKALEEKAFCGTMYSKNYNVLAGQTYKFYTNMADFSKDRLKLVSGQTANNTQNYAQANNMQVQPVVVKKDISGYKQNIQKLEKEKKYDELKKFTEEHPETVLFISDPLLRLTLTGPKGMKVGDIIKLKKAGKSELIIVSLVKRVKTPYKEYSIEEIEALQKMGLSDKIIASMIDITTELLKDEQRKLEQQQLIAEQKRIANQNRVSQQTQYNNTNNNQPQSNPIADKLTEEVTKQGVKMLLDHLF